MEQNEIFSKKGPVFATAIVAGVMAAKKTSEIIPFCHPIPLESCQIDVKIGNAGECDETIPITVDCTTKTSGKTGVEMEALVGANSAALCIYDMLKAVSHEIEISDIKLISKSGGKSLFTRDK